MKNPEEFQQKLDQLPLLGYYDIDPQTLEFSDRIRWICAHECPMYGKTWACPPGVGPGETCRARCLSYPKAMLIASVAEVTDISDIAETLATRPAHEALTDQVRDLLLEQGEQPFVLSTEACAICPHCTMPEGKPCRHPDRMHPCVESHGINIIPTLERCGLTFQYGSNVVTWVSLLFYGKNPE